MSDDRSDSVNGVPGANGHVIEVTDSRTVHIGPLSVRRALPTRGRRMVGAWCFVDHMGPETVSVERSVDIAPHPHVGLQTVTWLFSGELLHRDSLGTEQLIRPGQLNLMSAGRGVAHSEENPGLTYGQLHGIQLWLAQPSSTRNDPAAFEHHRDLPRLDAANATVTILVGTVDKIDAGVRGDCDLVGLELDLHGGDTTIGLNPAFEHALVVASGAAIVDGVRVSPGHLAHLGLGRDELRLSTEGPGKALLIGGVPFSERILMWWNFVARTEAEITDAWMDWAEGAGRFGVVASEFKRIEVGPPPWVLPLR